MTPERGAQMTPKLGVCGRKSVSPAPHTKENKRNIQKK